MHCERAVNSTRAFALLLSTGGARSEGLSRIARRTTVLFERPSIPSGKWPFLFMIERCIPELEALLDNEVDLADAVPVGADQLTISGCMECYKQAILRRVLDSTRATSLLWNAGNHYGAAVVARALFETIVSFHDFLRRAQAAREAEDYKALAFLVDMFAISTRDTELRAANELPRSVNVLTQVDQYAKHVEPLATRFYEQLSDFCHPNGYRMITSYGRISRKRYVIADVPTRSADAFKAIYNCCYQVCWLYSAITEYDRLLDRVRYLT